MNSRRIALEILGKVEQGAYSHLLLTARLKKIKDKRDRSLITELVYGVLRYQKRLDYIIAQLSKRPLVKLDKMVLLGLRLGLYQLEFLDRVPERAAVNETVQALKGLVNPGAIGFTNGLLRNYLRKREEIKYPKDPLNYLATYYSHPQWLLEHWLAKYGYQATKSLCEYNNRKADLFIRHNTLQKSQEDLIRAFKEAGLNLTPHEIPWVYKVEGQNTIEDLPLYQEGGFMVQGPAAALVSLILDPQPGERILDMAAGPGGKTTHLAQLMGNTGEILALDIYEHKLKLIEENCQRLGVKIVECKKADGRFYRDQQKFDRILVDAPCSGLGLIQQKPEIKWRQDYSSLQSLQKIQAELLANALQLLKKGGILVYSTCTLTTVENEEVVAKIMAEYQGKLKLINLRGELDQLGLSRFLVSKKGYLELVPVNTGTEGFFIAKFQVN